MYISGKTVTSKYEALGLILSTSKKNFYCKKIRKYNYTKNIKGLAQQLKW
jgi:hypothetical protein